MAGRVRSVRDTTADPPRGGCFREDSYYLIDCVIKPAATTTLIVGREIIITQ